MIGFFVKKAFFDGWDNLLLLAACNIVHSLIFALALVVPSVLSAPAWVSFTSFVLAALAMSVWQAACTSLLDQAACYGSPRFKEIFAAIPSALKPGLQMGAALLLIAGAAWVAIPFYISLNSFIGLLLASLLFWLCLFVLFSAQYFLPLTVQRRYGFLRAAKASAVMVLDNPGFSLFLFIHGLITIILSIPVAFLLPGLSGLALGQSDAVRLRLKKYDWLESNPGADRRKVPWEAILEEDRELVGKRTLKGMIFPWKDIK